MLRDQVKISSYHDEQYARNLEPFIGRTVQSIYSSEYEFHIVFTDGTSITLSGAQYGDCALGVYFSAA